MLKVNSAKIYEKYRSAIWRFIHRGREVLKLLGNKAMHLKNAKKPIFTLPEVFFFRNKNQISSLGSQELVPAVNSLEEVFL